MERNYVFGNRKFKVRRYIFEEIRKKVIWPKVGYFLKKKRQTKRDWKSCRMFIKRNLEGEKILYG